MATFKPGRRITAIAGSAALLAGLGIAGTVGTAHAAASSAAGKTGNSTVSCKLGNGIQHVVQLTFDNVHFFRDNPNVPSDLELMPNLLNFFTSNGTMLSNNHTPLIAHTGDDILTTETGLYGDRQGVGISNSYRTYNADGPGGTFNTTDPASAFAYWTDPIFDTAATPNASHDTNPNLVYSPVPPATAATPVTPDTNTPAPWVPYTRAGCNVGEVGVANAELENTAVDIPKVFGVNSPENNQLTSDKDSFKDQETADYVGIGVHCARGAAFCGDATAVKFGQTTPSKTAVSDLLPSEPGGYSGFQALMGHKYVAPQLGAGKPDVTHDGYQVTNAAGNLVDLNGNQINGDFLSTPGFPGFGPINAAQSLAYAADMLESGVPVVNAYMADLHGNNVSSLAACQGAPAALGSGSACYIAQAQYYNAAFGTFFKRLAADGITPANTLFVLSADEGDHEAGANVGRAVTPTPAGCDGATVSGDTVTPDVLCTYPSGSFGELAGNLTGLLATQKNNTTPFTVEADTAPEFYLTGNPGPTSPVVRQFEHDVAGLTAANPYTGTTQTIANYIADPVEESILHFTDADPARTPTFALFAKPDYFLSTGSATCPAAGCVTQNTGFAWDHGDYAAEINMTYLGLVGPGVKHLGIDGWGPAQGPNSAGPNSGQTVSADLANPGTWADHTDIEPTELYLTGLKADYTQDGTVITDVLTDAPPHLRSVPEQQLAACYKQLNASVGQFGAATLVASTKAVESSAAGDAKYNQVNAALLSLEKQRDALAIKVKDELNAAAFSNTPIADPHGQATQCQAIIRQAKQLAQSA
ncbi:hypothetical protein [Trebonia sp.]|uniref:hypothetical protein n=1 Tax=Trebonia sp. TaxID=2767075 RepID=UPI003CC60AB1